MHAIPSPYLDIFVLGSYTSTEAYAHVFSSLTLIKASTCRCRSKDKEASDISRSISTFFKSCKCTDLFPLDIFYLRDKQPCSSRGWSIQPDLKKPFKEENGSTKFWSLSVKAPPSYQGGKGETSNAPPGVARLSCLSSLTVSGMSTVVKGINCTCFVLSSLCIHLSSWVRECAFSRGQSEYDSILYFFFLFRFINKTIPDLL